MKRKFLLTFSIIYSLNFSAFSQLEKTYKPAKIDTAIPLEMQAILKNKLFAQKDGAMRSSIKRETAKYKCELYTDSYLTINQQFADGKFMLDTIFSSYLQIISDQIYTANPQLKRETVIYAYRSAYPNAFSTSGGVLAFHLGLLSKMQNESQIAFIICHELAHYHLKHIDQKIDQLAELNFDKTLEKKINEVKKTGGNQYEKYKQLIESLTLDITKHSRSNEAEADSVALIYLLKTNYNPLEAIRVMDILKHCDDPHYIPPIDLKKHFDSKELPFKDDWLISDMPDFDYHKRKYEDSDTASTHPDCNKREAAMKRILADKQAPTLPKNTTLERVMLQSDFETIESLYYNHAVGQSLYYTLVLLEKYPDNAYLHAMVGKCFYTLYERQKNKELGRVLDLPNSEFETNYNNLLQFIHALRLSEIAMLSNAYLENRAIPFRTDEEFLYAMILCSKLPGAKNNTVALIEEYKTKFPSGKYLNAFN
ncbi:MAG: M48 family metalloprotease [Cytophagaceae bacterium]|nr:M48 family metalloprotease [Cytophagaceae bacterium]